MNKKTLLHISTVAIIAPILLNYAMLWLGVKHGRGGLTLESIMLWLNPTLCLYLAVVLTAGWIVTALLSRSRSSHIFMGLATILCFCLYHIAVLYIPRCEIYVRQASLGIIADHLKAGDISEVRRAIRIHDEELSTTGDSLFAAQALLHELNRAFD